MKVPKIEDLSLEQKIGQLFLARTPKICAQLSTTGVKITEREVLGMLAKGWFSGFCAGRDTSPAEIREYQKLSPVPLFMATDIETGAVAQDMSLVTPLPMQMALGAIGAEKAAYDWASMAARETLAMGFNFAFGPVADLAVDPRSTLVGLRSFGSDPEKVSRLAAAAVKGYQENGLMVSVKHYPGFGGSPMDAHIRMNELNISKKTFLAREREVYKKIAARAKPLGVMTGHILVPAIDKTDCATTSRKLIQLLREAGYEDAVLITDSLAMKGLKLRMNSKYAHQRSLAAGHDLILSDYTVHPRQALAWIWEALKEKLITEEMIEASVKRILKAKEKIFSFKRQAYDFKQHLAASFSLSARAVTVEGELPLLDPKKNTLIIVSEEKERKQVRGELILESAFRASPEERLKKALPKSTFIRMADCPDAETIEKTLETAVGFDEILFIAYAYPGAYKGNSHFSRPLAHLIDGLAEKIKVLVVFGLPYAVNDLLVRPACTLFAYLGGFAERAAFDVLLNERGAMGTLPVPLKE